MPVGMLQMLQGMTKEQYDQVNEQMFGQSAPAMDQLPDGIIVLSAATVENGWYIYDIRESRDHFQRFADGQSREAVRAVFGDRLRPPGSEPQFRDREPRGRPVGAGYSQPSLVPEREFTRAGEMSYWRADGGSGEQHPHASGRGRGSRCGLLSEDRRGRPGWRDHRDDRSSNLVARGFRLGLSGRVPRFRGGAAPVRLDLRPPEPTHEQRHPRRPTPNSSQHESQSGCRMAFTGPAVRIPGRTPGSTPTHLPARVAFRAAAN